MSARRRHLRLVVAGLLALVPTTLLSSPSADAGTGCYRLSNGLTECYIWHTAPSMYDGVNNFTGGYLNKGWNYVYCQQDGNYETTYAGYRNHWYVFTDDDNGHRHVWVSAVYVSSGANDQPVPNLPRTPWGNPQIC